MTKRPSGPPDAEGACRRKLEHRLGLLLADLLLTLAPALDLVELGLVLAGEGQEREERRARARRVGGAS